MVDVELLPGITFCFLIFGQALGLFARVRLIRRGSRSLGQRSGVLVWNDLKNPGDESRLFLKHAYQERLVVCCGVHVDLWGGDLMQFAKSASSSFVKSCSLKSYGYPRLGWSWDKAQTCLEWFDVRRSIALIFGPSFSIFLNLVLSIEPNCMQSNDHDVILRLSR